MTFTGADSATFRFSTDDLPERDRVATFRDVFGHTIANLDLEPLGDDPFRCEAVLRALPGLAMSSIVSSAQHVRRTKQLIAADGNDNLVLNVPLKGTTFVSQLGREATVADGDAVLLFNAEPGSVSYLSVARILSLRLPAAALAPMISDLDAARVGMISRDSEAMRLLVGYVALLRRDDALMTPELRHLAVTHVHDLVALAIGATRDAAAIAQGRGVRAARQREILAEIRSGFADPAFSPEDVARKLRISPRYLQKLLHDTDASFTERVLEFRLQRARAMLADRRHDPMKVIEIAHACGFDSISYFNRCFRRRFGESPTQHRGTGSTPD